MTVHALILAGGASSRWQGRDKGLIEWQGITLIEHVIQRLLPQVNGITISCNRNRERYQEIAANLTSTLSDQLLPSIISDTQLKNKGPLGGIASYFEQIQICDSSQQNLLKQDSRKKLEYVFICCCDTPLLPTNLLKQLTAVLESTKSDASYPAHAERDYWLNLLVNVKAGRAALASLTENHKLAKQFSVKNWLALMNTSTLPVKDALPFSNVNTPEHLVNLTKHLE